MSKTLPTEQDIITDAKDEAHAILDTRFTATGIVQYATRWAFGRMHNHHALIDTYGDVPKEWERIMRDALIAEHKRLMAKRIDT